MTRNQIIRLAAASLMIAIGTLIYLCSRQDIIFFKALPDCIINLFQGSISHASSPFHYFCVYCLPDGIWYAALLLFQSAFLSNSMANRMILWTSAALPFILELMQIIKCVPGTFDPYDLLTYLTILIIFILCKKAKNSHSSK